MALPDRAISLGAYLPGTAGDLRGARMSGRNFGKAYRNLTAIAILGALLLLFLYQLLVPARRRVIR